MAAVGNILLNISTGKIDFASIQSFTQIIGQAIGVVTDFAKKNDEFVEAMSRATLNIDKAKKATGFLIDTNKLLQATTRLSNAGLSLTEDQFKAVAVAATNMGQTTGDVNGEFDSLIRSLIMGTEKGLKPYGVALGDATSLSDKQKAAVKGLTEKYGEMEVSADTLTDTMEGLLQSLSDLGGSLWGLVYKSDTGFLGFVNDLSKAISELASDTRGIGFLKTQILNLMNTPGVGGFFETVAGAAFAPGQYKQMLENERNAAIAANDQELVRRQNDAAIAAADKAYADKVLIANTDSKNKKGGGSKKSAAEGMSQYEMRQAADMLGLGGSGGYDSTMDIGTGGPIDLERGPGLIETEIENINKKIEAEALLEEERARIDEERMASEEAIYDARMKQNADIYDSHMMVANSIEITGNLANSVAQGILSGNIKTVKSAAELVKGIALSLAIEAGIRGLMEAGNASADFASYRYEAGAVHASAAVDYFVTAAIAGAVAGGARIIAGPGGGHGKGQSHERAIGSQGGAQNRNPGVPQSTSSYSQQSTTVNVTLEGDAEGVFRVAKKGSNQAKANGDSGFAEG